MLKGLYGIKKLGARVERMAWGSWHTREKDTACFNWVLKWMILGLVTTEADDREFHG